MLQRIILISSFFGIILELFKTNKYLSRYYSIIPIFFLFCIISFNRMSRDFLAYEYAFKNLEYKQSLESGYQYLIDIAIKYGQGQEFIVFLSGLLFIITLMILMKNSSYLNLVIFGYTAYSLMYDITQTRNFIMYLIVSMSIIFVWEKKPFKHYALIAIATQFHSLALFYTPFYFINRIKKRDFEKVMIIVTVVLILVGPILMKLFIIVFPDKSNYALRTPGKGVLINYSAVLFDLIIVWVTKKFSENKIIDQEEEKLNVMYRFVWLSIIVLPFSRFFLEIIRIQRNAQLIKYVFVASSMKYLSLRQKLIVLLLIAVSLGLSTFFIITTNQIDLIKYLDENSLMRKMEVLFF